MTTTLGAPGRAGAARTAESLLTEPAELMTPPRLAALAPSRLSASRSLINLMARERWQIRPVKFEIDERAHGRAVYRIETGTRTFDFMVFSFEPVLEGRTGRIIGTNWDMMGSLVEGRATSEEIDATAAELPKLYAGRATLGTLVWCRSNRSLRLFDHAIERLASGEQPTVDELWDVGYLMRNTGLDGNGTFGTRSFLDLEVDHPLRIPYHAQMLAAYLMREFSFDLVEHLARAANPDAAVLDAELKRSLALGNGSGLGLVLFVNTHPALINRWVELRQRAIVHAAALELVSGSPEAERLAALLQRAAHFYRQDPFTYRAFESPAAIASGLKQAGARLSDLLASGKATGAALLESLAGEISVESWEVVAAILPELDESYADAALQDEAASELMVREPGMTLAELTLLIRENYAWALDIDMDKPDARHYIWYKSRDAEEPRRGPAGDVEGGRNWALDLPTDIQAVLTAITDRPGEQTVADLLTQCPELRWMVERIQGLRRDHYHSPHMNMLDPEFRAVHIIRFMNAAFHGLDRTVDSLDRNVLGLLFQGAPTRQDLAEGRSLDWIYPQRPQPLSGQEQR